MLPFNSKNIQELVENWNRAIPIDRWYRTKYHIPFNSEEHRKTNLIDIFFEFQEFRKYTILKKKEEKKQDEYIKGQGNFMKVVEYSTQDIDTLFEELDLDSID